MNRRYTWHTVTAIHTLLKLIVQSTSIDYDGLFTGHVLGSIFDFLQVQDNNKNSLRLYCHCNQSFLISGMTIQVLHGCTIAHNYSSVS